MCLLFLFCSLSNNKTNKRLYMFYIIILLNGVYIVQIKLRESVKIKPQPLAFNPTTDLKMNTINPM
ncbi:hypothetical protein HanXRQr2_Chr07g0301691 [Helianthus annuus]|uniref:Uncharacterized protein n=1 Tax=Helianthus annuus TaxID=4232 RepID=A0A9K3NGA5_HELAN|nr:hypothetical protein HanXRQr2_Chr07g0301691 [Helianthus annuus]KAJ0563622.1 hypothetical protein HanHA89_Chr07g0265181 [Helianthus annuus]KAJ0731724.1 hypothetical protein HanOQP8_Chr07g0255191 [Helianthus annuus]